MITEALTHISGALLSDGPLNRIIKIEKKEKKLKIMAAVDRLQIHDL